MSQDSHSFEDPADVAAAISRRLREKQQMVSVAESLTSGRLAAELGAAEASSEWFGGGVVAYASQVKYKILGVDPGPVITASCAQQMARGVADLIGSEVSVAVTGVGGPDPVEGRSPGTVFIAVHSVDDERVEEHRFDGDVQDVMNATTLHALRLLLHVIADKAD